MAESRFSRALVVAGPLPIVALLCGLAVLTWSFVYLSGVHAAIAGVMLGLVMSRRPAGRAAHGLEPWSNAVILPLFAFSSALVLIPQVAPDELDPAFWGILVGLPVGKLVGITIVGGLATRFIHRRTGVRPLTRADIGVDLWNLFNTNYGTDYEEQWGAGAPGATVASDTWQNPTAIYAPRFVRLNFTVDF